MVTNTLASDKAITVVQDGNNAAVIGAVEAVENEQVSSWLVNSTNGPEELGRARASAGAEQVSVWVLPPKAVQSSGSGSSDVSLPETPTWRHGNAISPWQDVFTQVGNGRTARLTPHEFDGKTVIQIFPRSDGKWIALAERPMVDESLQDVDQLRRGLSRQGWALGVLSALGAWLLSGALMGPARRASLVAQRLGEGDLSARVPVSGSDEIAQLGSRMNEMADSLQRMIGAQRHFISDTAHELRTPTAALLASASALENPATRDEAAHLVAPQLRRLSSLTEDLLALSRFDDQREVLDAHVVDLADLAVRAAEQVAAGQDVRVRTHGPVWATVDPARVATIVRNLVANGLRHGEAPVVVVVSESRGCGVIRVDDAGPGVPQEQREVIFDRFVRGDGARHGEGSGLGLTIARENAELHGGSLTLASDGHGFRLELPLSPAEPRDRGAHRVVVPVQAVPPRELPAVQDLLAGAFWNGAVAFAIQPVLGYPVIWGDGPGEGLMDSLLPLIGWPVALVILGRGVAVRAGSLRPWCWGVLGLTPLLLVLWFDWQKTGAFCSVALAGAIWTWSQDRRRPVSPR